MPRTLRFPAAPVKFKSMLTDRSPRGGRLLGFGGDRNLFRERSVVTAAASSSIFGSTPYSVINYDPMQTAREETAD